MQSKHTMIRFLYTSAMTSYNLMKIKVFKCNLLNKFNKLKTEQLGY